MLFFKRTLIFFVMVLTIYLPLSIYADELINTNEKAEKLYELGLLNGVGNDAAGEPLFELERPATRTEGIVMLIRLLGKEDEALSLNRTHPFTDVPAWADGYISYAYKHGITKGIGNNLFGAEESISEEMYKTLILRALGYCEGENSDFMWDNPYALSLAVGISDNTYSPDFFRKDIVDISYSALFSYVKNTNSMLGETLVSNGVLNSDDFLSVDKPDEFELLLSKRTAELSRFVNIYQVRDGYALLGHKGDNAVFTMIYDNDKALIKRDNPIVELPLMSKSANGFSVPDEIWSNKHGLQLYYVYYIEADVVDEKGTIIHRKGNYQVTFDVHYGTEQLEIIMF